MKYILAEKPMEQDRGVQSLQRAMIYTKKKKKKDRLQNHMRTEQGWIQTTAQCKTEQGTKWLNGVLTRHNINGALPRDNWSNPLHLSRATFE